MIAPSKAILLTLFDSAVVRRAENHDVAFVGDDETSTQRHLTAASIGDLNCGRPANRRIPHQQAARQALVIA